MQVSAEFYFLRSATNYNLKMVYCYQDALQRGASSFIDAKKPLYSAIICARHGCMSLKVSACVDTLLYAVQNNNLTEEVIHQNRCNALRQVLASELHLVADKSMLFNAVH